jgi:phosphoserine aminotransferase
MFDYRVQADNDSLYNTPPCFPIYMCNLVYKWVERQGGVAEMNRRNKEKAGLIYKAIDESGGFYKGHASPEVRSIMNVSFTLPDEELTKKFVKEAEAAKLDGLKGHRSVGGVRASIYNAFPREGCEVLAQFMRDFAAKN